MYAEGNIGVCGIAVLNHFSCGISAILTSKCDIAVFSATLRNAVFQHFGPAVFKIILLVFQCFPSLFQLPIDIPNET